MAFWKRKKTEKRKFNVDDVYVATATMFQAAVMTPDVGPDLLVGIF